MLATKPPGRATGPSIALVGTVLFVCVAAVALQWRLQTPHLSQMLGTDEADYVRAAAFGPLANYLGTRERSGVAMTAEVVQALWANDSPRPFQRDWEVDDAAGLRHYHPPLALYAVAAVARGGLTDPRALRSPPIFYGVLGGLASGLLAWLLLAGTPYGVRLAMSGVAGLLTAASPYHRLASTEIGPHALFSLLATLALAALTRALCTRERAWWLVGTATIGLAILTVPYWALLVPAALWVWWRARAHDLKPWQTLGAGVLALLAAAVVAWPPFLFELGIVKPVLMYVGIVLDPLGDRTPGRWMLDLATSHLLLAGLILGAAVAFFFADRRSREIALPTIIFVAAFAVVNLRVGHMKPLYASDVIPALAGLASAGTGLLLFRLAPSLASPVAVVIAAAVALATLPPLTLTQPERTWPASLAALARQFEGQRVLVTPRPAGAMLKYYLSDTVIVLDSNHPDDVPELITDLENGRISAAVRWGRQAEPGGAADRVLEGRHPEGRVEVGSSVVWWWNLEDRGNVRSPAP